MLKTRPLGVSIILSFILVTVVFSAAQLGTSTSIYNNILHLSFAQSPNVPVAPSIPRPIPPPSQDSPISPPPTVDQGNTENGDGGNGTKGW